MIGLLRLANKKSNFIFQDDIYKRDKKNLKLHQKLN